MSHPCSASVRSALSLVAVAVAVVSGPARANDRYLGTEGIVVSSAKTLPKAPTDAAWNAVKATAVPVASQRSVQLNDREANAAMSATPGVVSVRALATASDIAILLEWSDATADRAPMNETNVFGDAIAIEMPVKVGADRRLPYIGMGDEQENVVVAMVRAAADAKGKPADRTGTYVGAGFGSLTRAPLSWWRSAMVRDEAKHVWRAQFARPLTTAEHPITSGLFPIAIAVWDGHADQRGGNKMLSSWHVLRVPNLPVDPALLAQLSWGYGAGEVGDPAKGKPFVESVCVACHHIGDKRIAQPGIAPDLSTIGAISTYGYLRDSLLAPSAVVVPDLNPNRHYDKTKPTDPNGAYPNNAGSSFAIVDPTGKKTSKMPPFALPKEQLADVIAYLHTLGTSPAPASESKP